LPSESLDERLHEQRLVVLSGYLDTDTATKTAAELMTLDATGDDPVRVQLACADGDLGAAEMLADTVDLAGVEVRVRCLGVVGGPPLLVLAAADHRTIAPHATVQLLEPKLDMTGTATELSRAAEAHRAAVDRMYRRLAEASGRDLDAIAADCVAGRRLTAEEAVGYGLVHEVEREARPKQ
jgi:ATP-dependent Clp protease protease subunit